MTLKLLNKRTKEEVDFDPSDVNAAVESGQFAFLKGRGVPVVQNGRPMYTTPEDAAKYRKTLLFTDEDTVQRAKAEEATAGLGGALKATGLGLFKGATLGLGPAALAAASPEAAASMRELELGRPYLTTAGEVGGLLVDPFAAAAKLGGKAAQRGLAKGAAQLAEEAAAERAVSPALALGEAAATRAPAQVGRAAAEQTAEEVAQRAIGAEVSPPVLGRQVLAPTAEEAAQLRFREQARRGLRAREEAPLTEAEAAMAQAYQPLAGPVSAAEPGLRLGADIYRTPELLEQAAQAERSARHVRRAKELSTKYAGESAVKAEEAARLEREFAPLQAKPVGVSSESVRGELTSVEDALAANGEATRRVQSGAKRKRLAAEREQLLTQRDALEARLSAAEAEEDVAVAAQGAATMRTAAQRQALKAQRMGRLAGEVEAANVSPALGRMAETEMGAPDVVQRLGVPTPGVSPEGIGTLGTPSPWAAGVGTRMAETAIPAAEAAAPGFTLPGRAMAEQALYGGATQAYKQQLGLEPGGAKEVGEAALLGAAIPAALTLGGKAAGKVAGAAAEAAPAALGEKLRTKLGEGLERMEDTHIAKLVGLGKSDVERLNRRLTMPEAEKRGTTVFSDFMKGELRDIEGIKANVRNADNQFLQSITDNEAFRKLTPEQRAALAEGIVNKYGSRYDELLANVADTPVDMSRIEALIREVEKMQGPVTGKAAIASAAPELQMLRDAVDPKTARQLTLDQLRDERSRIGEIFETRNGENKAFTEAQSKIYKGLHDIALDTAEAAAPGAKAAILETDRAYEIAKLVKKGTEKLVAGAAIQSPMGRDSLAQFALGVVIGRPFAAAAFLAGTTGLRHLYNQRGDGILADMAGKASRKLLNIAENPQQAAKVVSESIINAKRPMLALTNSERLVEGEPEQYGQFSRSVRQLQATKDEALKQVQTATKDLSPEEQQAAMQHFDQVVNALASNLPKGLSTDKALTEQEKRYMVFARSVLDNVYATQAIVDGGTYADEAARALQSTPGGQQYLTSLAEDLRNRINETQKLRGNPVVAQVYRNVVRASGGGLKNLRTLHAAPADKTPGIASPKGSAPAPRLGASGQKAAASSLAGVYSPAPRVQ